MFPVYSYFVLFCLAASFTAVGLSGAEVRQLPFEEAVQELVHLHEENPSIRTAIIIRRGLIGLTDKLERILNGQCVYDHIDTSMVSVITVEEAKGLEFEAVLVVDNLMSVNEMYVSYTRALDNLIITTI